MSLKYKQRDATGTKEHGHDVEKKRREQLAFGLDDWIRRACRIIFFNEGSPLSSRLESLSSSDLKSWCGCCFLKSASRQLELFLF